MPPSHRDMGDLVRYSAWASKRMLEFAIGLSPELLSSTIRNSHGGILKTFQHIYYVDRVWLSRLEDDAPKPFADPEPGPSLHELNVAWWPMLDRLAACAEMDVRAAVRWRYTGTEYLLDRSSVVLHAVNHATYHRGQIAAMLRNAGQVPPPTDLVLFQLGL